MADHNALSMITRISDFLALNLRENNHVICLERSLAISDRWLSPAFDQLDSAKGGSQAQLKLPES